MLSYRCSEFLELLHIPTILASTLEQKLTNAKVGLEEKFKVEQRPLQPKALESRPPSVAGCAELFEEYWSWCFGCTWGLEDVFDVTEELEWHLEAPEILCIPHADSPNVIVRALPPVLYETLQYDVFRHGASILCLISSVVPNQMLKRDIIPKKRTKNRIARLLTLIGDAPHRWAHESELAGLQQLNDCSSPTKAGKYEVAKPIAEKSDARPLAAMTEFTPTTGKVFSDYPTAHAHLSHHAFEMVSEFEECNILFAVNPIANFNSLGRRLVNQFPHETNLICPRRLLHAVRSHHYDQGVTTSGTVILNTNADATELFPEWFPLSFDLKSELKLFLEIHEKLEDPWWLAVAGEAGATDWCLTKNVKTIAKYMEANDGNWVIQRAIHDPLLHKGSKVMMSMFLLVCAFDPLDAYLYKRVYGTAASCPYSLEAEFLADELVQLPFEDPTQTVLSHDAFVEILAAEGIPWEDAFEKMTAIVRELLESVRRRIGASQRSRAVYRLDFNIPAVREDCAFQPQLSRAVFAPDLGTPAEFDSQFVNQLFEVLFLEGCFPESFLSINDGLDSDSDATDVTGSFA